MQPALGSVQFPSLIGLPTRCLLPITAAQADKQVGGTAGRRPTIPGSKMELGMDVGREGREKGLSAERQMFLTER